MKVSTVFSSVLSVIPALFVATTVHAASFDCGKASSKVEKLICTNAELDRLDSQLSETYKEALPKDSSVKTDQLNWLKQRNSCSNAECLVNAYKSRISDLEEFIVRYNRSIASKDLPQREAPSRPPSQASNENQTAIAFCIGYLEGHHSLGGQLRKANLTYLKTHEKLFDRLGLIRKKLVTCAANDKSTKRTTECINTFTPAEKDIFLAWDKGAAQNEVDRRQNTDLQVGMQLRACSIGSNLFKALYPPAITSTNHG